MLAAMIDQCLTVGWVPRDETRAMSRPHIPINFDSQSNINVLSYLQEVIYL